MPPSLELTSPKMHWWVRNNRNWHSPGVLQAGGSSNIQLSCLVERPGLSQSFGREKMKNPDELGDSPGPDQEAAVLRKNIIGCSSHGHGSHVSARTRTCACKPAHACFLTFALLKGHTPMVGKQDRNAESVKKIKVWGILSSTVVRTVCFQSRRHGFDLWLRSYESTGHTAQPKKKKFPFYPVVFYLLF